MKEFANAFGLGVQWVCLTGLAAFAIWFILHASFIGHSILWRHLRSLRLPDCLLALLAIGYCTHIGAMKTNRQNNARQQMMMSPRTMAPPSGTNGLLRVENWHRRGAWEDSIPFEFDSGWTFPCGTGRLAGVEIFSCGEIRPDARATNVVARLPVPLAQVPFDTEFRCGRTASNSYAFEWIGGHPDRLADETMDGRIELFRNGDWSVATNGVEYYNLRVLPYGHDGYGQDDEWVAANFANAAEVLTIGYTNWVDQQVGTGLENGLYKFIVVFTNTPEEAVRLTVGDLAVAVTNAGECAFLLKKGIEYQCGVDNPDIGFVREAVDDMADRGAGPFRLGAQGADATGAWAEDGGWFRMEDTASPTNWNVLWMPTLKGTPDIPHMGANFFPSPFAAELTDVCGDVPVAYSWTSSDPRLQIASSTSPSTWVDVTDLPSFGYFNLALSATFGNTSLTSMLQNATFGTNSTLQVTLSIQAPEIIFVDDAKRFPFSVCFESPVQTNGVVSLCCNDEGEKVGVYQTNAGGNALDMPIVWDAGSFTSSVFFVEGVYGSDSRDDVSFVLSYQGLDTGGVCVTQKITVVEVYHFTKATVPSDRERLVWGVGEEISFFTWPQECNLSVSSSVGLFASSVNGHHVLISPLNAQTGSVYFACQETFKKIDVEFVAPETYLVENITPTIFDVKGESGLFELYFDNLILPTNVSFYALQVIEVPMVSTNAVGYFADPSRSELLDHGKRGAGNWSGVSMGNGSYDIVLVGCNEKPWGQGGSYTWPIPNAWRWSLDPIATNVFTQNDQRFELDADGTARVKKFGYCGERTTNSVFRLTRENEL